MKLTKSRQNALMRMNDAITLIKELVPLEIEKGESQARRKKIVRAYETLKCHGFTLNVEIPKLSNWYYPKHYLVSVDRIADQLKRLQ